MNWINTPLKLLRLISLGLMLGSGLVSAAEPEPPGQAKPVVVHLTTLDEAQPVMQTEPILIAWDRVGAMA